MASQTSGVKVKGSPPVMVVGVLCRFPVHKGSIWNIKVASGVIYIVMYSEKCVNKCVTNVWGC